MLAAAVLHHLVARLVLAVTAVVERDEYLILDCQGRPTQVAAAAAAVIRLTSCLVEREVLAL
jgi:hypothetical protein